MMYSITLGEKTLVKEKGKRKRGMGKAKCLPVVTPVNPSPADLVELNRGLVVPVMDDPEEPSVKEPRKLVSKPKRKA